MTYPILNSTSEENVHPQFHNAYVDVKAHYSAVGDGVTDDAAAIQAAITQAASDGGVVYFPPGVYALASGLTLAANVTLQGAGDGATSLKHNAGASALMTLSGSGLAPSGVTIRDLSLLGGTGTGDGIQLNGTSGANITSVRIEDVFFFGLDGSYGIKATWALETHIERCTFLGQANVGIGLIKSSNASLIRDCVLSNGGFGTTAILLTDEGGGETLVGVTIDGCVIEAWRGTEGVKVDGAGPVRIRDSHFEDIDGAMLWVGADGVGDYSHDIMVDSCHFTGGGGATSLIDMTSLNATLINNDCSTNNVILETAGGGNATYYTLIGNRFVASAALTDNTTANQDHVVLLNNRGITNPTQLSRSVTVLSDRGVRWTESGDPSAPAANNVVIYARDSGGKTQLVARFATGAVQQLAIEP